MSLGATVAQEVHRALRKRRAAYGGHQRELGSEAGPELTAALIS